MSNLEVPSPRNQDNELFYKSAKQEGNMNVIDDDEEQPDVSSPDLKPQKVPDLPIDTSIEKP